MAEPEKTKNIILNGVLTLGLCMISVMILPLHVYYLPPVMIMWVMAWIIENKSEFNMNMVKHNKAAVLFLLFIVFYFWQIAGLLFAESLDTGFERLFKRLSFILFPLVLFYPGSRITKNIDLIIRLFAICTFVYVVYCFGNAFHHSIMIQNNEWIFEPRPAQYDYENYFYGSRLSDPVHPSYLAMYIVISVLISFEALFDNTVTHFKKGIWISMIIIFILVLYLLSARAGILAGIIIFPIYFLLKLYARLPKWIILIVLFAMVALLVALAKTNNRVSLSITNVSKEKIGETLKSDPRLLIWKSAFGVVRKNLIFGVGTGDATMELKEEFMARGYIDGYYDNLNAHNQFLEILLENGLIGFILFLTVLGYMINIALKRKNILLGLFVVGSVIFFIFETMLNRLAGVSFFALFSFLLIYADKYKPVDHQDTVMPKD
jgi:O-antigen ligase